MNVEDNYLTTHSMNAVEENQPRAKRQRNQIEENRYAEKSRHKQQAQLTQLKQNHQNLVELTEKIRREVDLIYRSYCDSFPNTTLKTLSLPRNEDERVQELIRYLPQTIKIIVYDSIERTSVENQQKQRYLAELEAINPSVDSIQPPPAKKQRLDKRKNVENVDIEKLSAVELHKLRGRIHTRNSHQKQQGLKSKLLQENQQFLESGNPIEKTLIQYRKAFPNTALQPMNLSDEKEENFNYLYEYIPSALKIILGESIVSQKSYPDSEALALRIEELTKINQQDTEKLTKMEIEYKQKQKIYGEKFRQLFESMKKI